MHQMESSSKTLLQLCLGVLGVSVIFFLLLGIREVWKKAASVCAFRSALYLPPRFELRGPVPAQMPSDLVSVFLPQCRVILQYDSHAFIKAPIVL